MEVINWVKVMLNTTTTVGDGTSLATYMILLNHFNGVVRPVFPNVLWLRLRCWMVVAHFFTIKQCVAQLFDHGPSFTCVLLTFCM